MPPTPMPCAPSLRGVTQSWEQTRQMVRRGDPGGAGVGGALTWASPTGTSEPAGCPPVRPPPAGIQAVSPSSSSLQFGLCTVK